MELKQDLMGWGIRVGEVALIGGALIYKGICENNYALAQAAVTQADQDLYYGNATAAYNVNLTLLILAGGLYVFNIAEAYLEADSRARFAQLELTPTTVALRWKF